MHLVLQSVHFESVWDIVSASISTQVSNRADLHPAKRGVSQFRGHYLDLY